jgi:hypothetical protein
MTVEYVLLLALFSSMLMGAIVKGPYNAFTNAGPKLGARIEKHLSTGAGFESEATQVNWKSKER